MRRASLPTTALAAALSGLLAWSLSAHAQFASGSASTASSETIAACERAARQALPAQAAGSAEVTFDAAPNVQPTLSNDSQVVLRGVGRRRGSGGVRSFTYNCNVDLRTAQVVGVVISTPVAAQTAPARMPSEPDLSQLSPAACESGAVQALKRRWPSVAQIVFDSATRRFLQKSPSRAELHGQGHAQSAPGQPTTFFGFDCEIDTRDGRVLGMRVSA